MDSLELMVEEQVDDNHYLKVNTVLIILGDDPIMYSGIKYD